LVPNFNIFSESKHSAARVGQQPSAPLKGWSRDGKRFAHHAPFFPFTWVEMCHTIRYFL